MLIVVGCRLYFFYLMHLVDEVSWRLLLRLGNGYFARRHAVLVQHPEVIVPERTAILHMIDFVLQFVSMASSSMLVKRLRAHKSAWEFTLALSSNRQRSDQFLAFFLTRWLLHILQIDAVLAHDKLNHGLYFALSRLWICMLLKLVTYLW